jgi:hypothetical protein
VGPGDARVVNAATRQEMRRPDRLLARARLAADRRWSAAPYFPADPRSRSVPPTSWSSTCASAPPAAGAENSLCRPANACPGRYPGPACPYRRFFTTDCKIPFRVTSVMDALLLHADNSPLPLRHCRTYSHLLGIATEYRRFRGQKARHNWESGRRREQDEPPRSKRLKQRHAAPALHGHGAPSSTSQVAPSAASSDGCPPGGTAADAMSRPAAT